MSRATPVTAPHRVAQHFGLTGAIGRNKTNSLIHKRAVPQITVHRARRTNNSLVPAAACRDMDYSMAMAESDRTIRLAPSIPSIRWDAGSYADPPVIPTCDESAAPFRRYANDARRCQPDRRLPPVARRQRLQPAAAPLGRWLEHSRQLAPQEQRRPFAGRSITLPRHCCGRRRPGPPLRGQR